MTAFGFLGALNLTTDVDLNLGWVLLGLAVSALTHYLADRRVLLRRAALALGKNPTWLETGGGLYALDQSFHYLWLFVAALIIA